MKVAEVEEEVVKAEALVRAAERALVMARSGGSANEVSSKWETAEIDDDAERIESGKVHEEPEEFVSMQISTFTDEISTTIWRNCV